MDVAGVIVGCFAVALSVCLYFKSKRHTDNRFNGVESVAKRAEKKAGQAGKAVGAHKGHKERKKKKEVAR